MEEEDDTDSMNLISSASAEITFPFLANGMPKGQPVPSTSKTSSFGNRVQVIH